ncbi:MAG: DUF2470 domain-containing protein [Mycobacteriaceae bacterium]|nr:DUF2470 domain-containing protein [Mycobacteriaceae bacterium]
MTGLPTTATDRPCAAERVHSVCHRASDALLAVPGAEPVTATVHQLRPGAGAELHVVLATPMHAGLDDIATADARNRAMLELTDRAAVRLRNPVRSLVWLRGRLFPVPQRQQRALAGAVAADRPHARLLDVGHTVVLMRMVLDSAVLADGAGAEPVEAEALRQSRPDPFCEQEAAWLHHLETDHPEVIDYLSRRIPVSHRRGRLRPLALDRYGLTMRSEQLEGDRDIRLPFANPADDFDTLGRALRVLIGCPFRNGPRTLRPR